MASPSPVVRQRVLDQLRSPLRRFEQASGGADALARLEGGFWQVLFLDRHLPDLDATELSDTVRQRFPEIEVVLLDPENDAGPNIVDDAIENVTERSASQRAETSSSRQDVPASNERWLGSGVESGWGADKSSAVAGDFVPQFAAESPLPGMVGRSRVMQPVYRLIRLLAPRKTTVLITGPTGSGKEVVARALHQLSPRAGHAFAVVNCAAIPETLLEAELFGYARGAFTGAMQSYAGRIQAAQGGTLFLDEIGEMPLSLQPKLLRFLEQKELQRLGSSEVVRVDARVVSATNAHLLSLVKEGKFREDLYYRLCTFPIEIPPLRERSEDVVALAAHFLGTLCSRPSPPQLSTHALQMLKAYSWPGNIRELQNVMERALILAEDGPLICPEHLMLNDGSASGARSAVSPAVVDELHRPCSSARGIRTF
ncbi:MAG TPA: sigma-54 dependent transcriptional regulator [Terriglobales bacterium]|nr:sigma-54 dependent transcriptional regulator [Terriglobales bacterium]